MLHIAPSILSADFGAISEEIARVYEAGATWIHLDVMDGQFVPNITFGQATMRSFQKPEGATFDAHLMIDRPERYVEAFAEAGADMISVHPEATTHLHSTLQQIKACGAQAAVALNPATPIDVLDWVYEDLDMILLMSVNPGWGGQSFIEAVYDKIKAVSQQLQQRQLEIPIQVDGGVNLKTIRKVVAAGASNLVAGSAMFSGERSVENYRQNYQALLKEAQLGLADRGEFV